MERDKSFFSNPWVCNKPPDREDSQWVMTFCADAVFYDFICCGEGGRFILQEVYDYRAVPLATSWVIHEEIEIQYQEQVGWDPPAYELRTAIFYDVPQPTGFWNWSPLRPEPPEFGPMLSQVLNYSF